MLQLYFVCVGEFGHSGLVHSLEFRGRSRRDGNGVLGTHRGESRSIGVSVWRVGVRGLGFRMEGRGLKILLNGLLVR